MHNHAPEVLRYQGRQYDMEGDPLHAYFLAGGQNPGFHGIGWRGYKGTWEILDDRVYLTALIGNLEDATQVGLSSVFPNNLERVFADWYTGALKCPLGIGHEVTNGCFDHPAHLYIYVEAGVVHEIKEVPNPKFADYFDIVNGTSEINDKSFFMVYIDHMTLHDERHGRRDAPLLNSLSLSVIADFVLRCKKYYFYMSAVENIHLSTIRDFDGFPLEERYNFFFEGNPDAEKTMLFVTFHDCSWSETDYDYIDQAYLDRSTAYKIKIRPKGDTKFKIYSAQFIRRCGGGQSWFIAELQRYKTLLDRLDAATLTLQSWAGSGLSMRVYCSKMLCSWPQGPSEMPAERLNIYAKKGWSLDELKQKLKCRECGSPADRLAPGP